MTPKAVFANPEFARLCVGASRVDVEGARKTEGPHAHTAVFVYMNEPAARAFPAKGAKYPVGAVVVKEKHGLLYRGDGPGRDLRTPDGVGGMIKRPAGYDPEHGDWEYFYFEKADRIERAGSPPAWDVTQAPRTGTTSSGWAKSD